MAAANDAGVQTYAPACIDMISIFTSCTSRIDGFTTLAFQEQASCYCCRSSGRRAAWTDELDSYATTCADWAITAEPKTAYPVAKTFATFCERFTDVCDSSETVSELSTTTDDGVGAETDSSSSHRGGVVTVTQIIGQMGGSTSPASDGSSHKGGLSTGAIAGIAVGAGIVALLALSGVFLWCWKTKRSSPGPTTVQHIQPTQHMQPTQHIQPTQQLQNSAQQQQPVVYMPYGQQSPLYGSPPPFSPVYSGNNSYQTSSIPPPPPGQTQFVAELPTGKEPVEVVEAGGTEVKR